MSNRYLDKLASARWLWTVAACGAFILMVIRRDLSNQEALQVISFIVAFYFAQRGQDAAPPRPEAKP